MTRKLITEAEALNLVKQVSGNSAKLVRYYWRPYSEDQIGYLGSHWQLIVEILLEGNVREHLFFVKAMPETPTELEYVKGRGVFDQEAIFFQKIIPELVKNVDIEPWSPKCYLANKEVVVLEDLGERKYVMSPRLFDKEILKSALRTLAHFHASSILTEARLGKSLYELYPNAFREMGYVGSGKNQDWVMAGKDVAVAVADSLGLNSSKIHNMFTRVIKTARDQDETKPRNKTMVASHGDLWPNNIMLDDSKPPRCMFVDFQFTRYAPPAQDLVFLLHLSTSSNFRAKFEREMVDFYYLTFSNAIERNNPSAQVLTVNELREEILEQKLRAVVSAALYFPAVFANGEFVKDVILPDNYEKFQYVDRRKEVFELMQRNEFYRSRIEDAVRELVDYGEQYFKE